MKVITLTPEQKAKVAALHIAAKTTQSAAQTAHKTYHDYVASITGIKDAKKNFQRVTVSDDGNSVVILP